MHTFHLHPAFLRVGLPLACILLAGCTTSPSSTSVGVSSPPPPVFGSAPISAHDDYAQTLVPAPSRLRTVVAQAGGR